MFFTKKHCQGLALSGLIATTLSTHATVVTFETSQGDISVNLFDKTTPKTVDNFLNYVNEGTYNQSVIHRSVAGFITQGGGFTFDGQLTKLSINATVINEPVYSNVKGTIAMAKLGGDANSATNQWFFNLANNSANLDVQNGGFTVFGQVVAGMDVVERIAALKTCNLVLGSSSTPAPVTTGTQCIEGLGIENLVSISNVDISDASDSTSDSLTPIKNSLINGGGSDDSSGRSSGGTFGWLSLLALGLVWLRRQRF